MICLGGIFFVLGLPLLIIYAIQENEKKNKLWLKLGLIFLGATIVCFVIGWNTGSF